MGFLSKIFGTSPETEKENKFKEIEREFVGKFELANLHKAQWLANRGNDFRQHGQFDQAVEDFQDVIKLNPNHIEAYLSWSMVYAKQGMLKEAIDILEKAPKESTGFNVYRIHELLSALGVLYMEIDDKEKAIDHFEKTLKAIIEQKNLKEAGIISEQDWIQNERNMVKIVEATDQLLKELKKEKQKEDEMQVVFFSKKSTNLRE